MKCVFCSKPQEPGRGTIFAYNDGRVIYFCSSKCKRNFKLKRDPKKIKWAKQRDKQEKNIAFDKKRKSKDFQHAKNKGIFEQKQDAKAETKKQVETKKDK